MSSGGRPARNQLAGVIRGARWRPSGGRPERHQLPSSTCASGGKPSSCSLWGGHSRGSGGRRLSSGGRPPRNQLARVPSGARWLFSGGRPGALWRLSGGSPARHQLPLRTQAPGGKRPLTSACDSGGRLKLLWTSEECSPGGSGDRSSPACLPKWTFDTPLGLRG